MGAGPFGAFRPLCHSVPSYPICNVFFRQLLRTNNTQYLTDAPNITSYVHSAPVGVMPNCGIPRITDNYRFDGGSHLGNIANILAIGLSIFAVLGLLFLVQRRKAAVGRIEFRFFLLLYLLSLPLQLVTTGSFLRQGSTPLVIVTAIHMGVVTALFWTLLANGIIALQIVEDGTLASLVPFTILTILFFAAPLYISLDTGFGFTDKFNPSSNPGDLRSISLFIFLDVWPPFCALAYFVIMAVVVVTVLREFKPLVFYAAAAILFVLSQLDYFLLNKVICRHTSQKIDGSFVATVLETLAVGALTAAWISITEESWTADEGGGYAEDY